MVNEKSDVEQLKGILQQFRKEDIEKALGDLSTSTAGIEAPFEIVKMSDLPVGKEERTKIIVMDKKLIQKIGTGEEQKLAEIASKGVLEYTEAPTGIGQTVIKGETLTISQLSTSIMRDFGAFCSGGAVFLSDGFYFLYTDAEIQKVLSEDLTDLNMWINTYFDCDDFAQVVAGVMNDKLKGVPFGVIWFKGPNFYHATNCYYSWNQKKMKIVEPQNDAIYNFNKADWCPMLVLI
jgi:hypothetical protein